MYKRTLALLGALLVFVVAGLPAQSKNFSVDELRPGMVGIGRTVFEGDTARRVQGRTSSASCATSSAPQRNLILARLEGGPLAKTGVIAGMSGSPVYIDGRLVGAVSYSLGQFSKEPIAGITPIAEMIDAATLAGAAASRRRASICRCPLTQDELRASLRQAFSWMRPFADSPTDVQVFGASRRAIAGHRHAAPPDCDAAHAGRFRRRR